MMRSHDQWGEIGPQREVEKRDEQIFLLGQTVPVIRSDGRVDSGWLVTGAEQGSDGKICYTLKKSNMRKDGESQDRLLLAGRQSSAEANEQKRQEVDKKNQQAKQIVENLLAKRVTNLDQFLEEVNLALASLGEGKVRGRGNETMIGQRFATFKIEIGGKETVLELSRNEVRGFGEYFLLPQV